MRAVSHVIGSSLHTTRNYDIPSVSSSK